MAVVVRGVVHSRDMGKANAADDESAEQKRGEGREYSRRRQRGVDAASGFGR